MKFLEIIIPQYKEDDALIDRLLSSINKQKNVDFNDIEITLINDASDVIISQELINKYNNLDIKYLKNDINMGVGPTRQRAVDQTESKYITFIDADDELYDENSLALVISCLKDTNKDILFTNVMVEKNVNGKNVLINKFYGASSASLHGRFIKREFLEKNNKKFKEELRNNYEDSYYCMALVGADTLNTEIIHLNIASYVWHLNMNSITRNNETDYFDKTIDEFFKCTRYVADFLEERKSFLKDLYVIDSIMFLYHIIKSRIFMHDKDEYINKLYELCNSYRQSFDNVKEEDKRNKYNETYNRLVDYRSKDKIGTKTSYNMFLKEIM